MNAVVPGTGRTGIAKLKILAKKHPKGICIYSRAIRKATTLINELQIDTKTENENEFFNSAIIIHTSWYQYVLVWVKKYKEELSYLTDAGQHFLYWIIFIA